MLEAVGKSRRAGVVLPQLTKLAKCKALNKLQAVHYQVATLQSYDAIVKRDVMLPEGKGTNIVSRTAYVYLKSQVRAPQDGGNGGGGGGRRAGKKGKTDGAGADMVTLENVKALGRMFEAKLAAAEGGVMVDVDLRVATYEWLKRDGWSVDELTNKKCSSTYGRVRAHLVETKAVERIKCELAREDGGHSHDAAKKSLVDCLRLLRPPPSSSSAASAAAAASAKKKRTLALPAPGDTPSDAGGGGGAAGGSGGGASTLDEADEDDAAGGGSAAAMTCGGGLLAMDKRMEDQIVELAKVGAVQVEST
jgi:hypothetical protein